VLTARNIVTGGGNAVDAGVAMGLALTVIRYPQRRVSLGCGVYLVRDALSGVTEAIEFIALELFGR
jgi:gamma-glutamyltranspeptidase